MVSLLYVYGGRGTGLVWTVALIHQLGISDYGLYSLGFALMSVLGQTLSNPYVVRAVREPAEDFVRERAGRYLLGLALMVLGQVFLPLNYVAWFGVTVAGGELIVGAYKARAMRQGDPHVTSRIDTSRQVGSVVAGCAYLFGAALMGLQPTLLGASVAYCVPYVVIAVLAAVTVRGHRPQWPGPPRTILVLAGEMLGTSMFLAGDVLLLGWLTDTTVVGYYNLTWVVASSVCYVGQAFGTTYAQTLRDSGGDLSTGPPLKYTVAIGVGGGLLVLIVGVGLLISPAPQQLAVAMIIMSAYCAFRTVIMVFQFVLYAQRRDMVRMTSVIGLVPLKFGLLAALAHLGAVGAAIATSVADAALLVIFSLAIYGKGRHGRRPAKDDGDVPVVERPGDGAGR
ncbi:lipopolysaccharide biosynthesis protein [Mycolicibacterium pulveris]|uniref:lipopolysaccharide biosynthesis protein n=1 Tax=Mycolicibacterium pulveris TaxID=36813 RepID=UPI003CF9F416